MHTYRDLFRTPEFTPLFLTSTLQVAGSTVSTLALGTLVYASTGSPLLSALAMFGPSLAQVLGATVLLSAADRLPPRAALTGLALVFALCTAGQTVPGLPVWGTFLLLFALGTVAALGGGVRYGLLHQILARDGFLIGRSVLNMSVGTMQICGFAVGGVLLTALAPRGVLLGAVALYLAAAVVARLGLARHPARAAGRPSLTQTWRTNALLWSSRPRRAVYLALWVPNGLIVGCESLFVAYDSERAGVLFLAGAVGMLAGDTLVGRFVPARWRQRLSMPLRALLAVPYLLFALHPPLPVAVIAVLVASVGFAASLLLQERLMALTPDETSGHALGLYSAGLLALQGVGAALAGAVAEVTSPPTAMTAMALLSLAVTVALTPGLRAQPAPGAPARRPSPAGSRGD
ncbi:MFS transporter [Streptomyces sp. DSM 42041]|uniref:MFS transporter n=1 Tax=Streptomyces hazeniae TaxID=3075538 RepID=A0ABU2P020_9ACTN|nr:MFS transporter [Streptomyces sp. DSM 42041]MDT0382117.1 MFS transporter [Streptomyces sp. DSM 42041]